MKATPTLQQAIVEKCLNDVWQPLPIIVFTLLFSISSTSHGSYLLARDSNAPTSRDKSEGEYDHTSPVSFQEVQDIVAQPTIAWDKTLGGNRIDNLRSAIPTPDGGYLLAGFSFSDASGDKSENRKGQEDYWIVKTDALGNKVWDKTLGGSSFDYLSSAISTPDGGYLLAGYSGSNASGDKSENSKGESDYWVVKIDALGNKVWDKTIGGSSHDNLHSTISTPDGGYLLAGSSGSPASGDKSENRKGEIDHWINDYWVVKIDAEGNKVWDKTIGGRHADELYIVIPAVDGGYLLAGYSNSPVSGDKSEDNKGEFGEEYDYWVVKIDANGNKVWDKTIGGKGFDNLRSAISTPDGGYLLAGDSESDASGDKSENKKGNESDYWVVKIDANGNKMWDKTLGGNNHEQLQSAIPTTDGGYLLTGTSWSNASGDKSEDNKGSTDYWIVKINEQGNKVWDKTIGGSMTDFLYSAIPTTDGDYLLAGDSKSDISGDKSEHSKGDYDYWIVKLQDQNIPVVISLTIINAQTDQEIRELKDRDYVSLEEVGNGLLNIRANTFPEKIDRVRFDLKGPITHTQVEKTPPYALFGDSQGNYAGRKFIIGKYVLTVTPYTKDKKGVVHTISFEVIKDIIVLRPTIEWDKTIGGSNGDGFRSAISTPDGGYLLAGSSASNASGDKSEDSKGGGDYWIVKTDAQGNKQWDKTLGGSDDDVLRSAISTPDGGYLLAGNSGSNVSGDKSENNKGEFGEEYDYWVVKIDANGNKMWDKTLGGNNHEQLQSAISTPDGGYLLGGYSFSDASGDKSENSKGQDDYWVVKIDAQGNKVWDKTLGGSRAERIYSIIPTPDGGYLLGGFSDSNISGDKSEHSKGDLDYWVVKTDAQGNKVWDKTIGGDNYDVLSSAISTPDGGYLLAGDSESSASGDKSEHRKGEGDYWVVKIDAQGNKVWDKTIGGYGYDAYLNSAIPTPDGGFLVGGISYSNASGDKSEDNKGSTDYWVVKIDAQGNKVWDKTIGGNNFDEFRSITPTVDGGYLLAGDSWSDVSGDKSEHSKGGSDYWIVKLKDHTTPIVTSLTLMDAQTDQEIQELKNEDAINLAEVGSGLLNIRANTSGSIDHVSLQLQGPVRHKQTEKQFPYTLFGDNQGDYAGRQLPAGRYTLTATPFFKNTKGIALTISFEVAGAPEATARQVKVYPVPTSDVLNILYEGVGEEAHLMLLDFRGKVLLHQPLSTQPVEQVDLSGFKKGTYYLRIVSAEGIRVFRVAKE